MSLYLHLAWGREKICADRGKEVHHAMDWREGEGAAGGGAEATEEGGGAAVVPGGLQAVLARCSELYPGQPNPLQVTALLKYW